MANPAKILRASIFTFLQNLHRFASTPALLAAPFAASTLISPTLASSSSLFRSLHGRLGLISLSAGIPPHSQLFPILNLKLSQTLLSSLFVFPFAISSLLLAKASVITAVHHEKPARIPSFIAIFHRLLITQFCNSLLIIAANATCLSLLIFAFNFSDVLGLSSPRFLLLLSALGVITYSVILANAYLICSSSLIVSATENRGGFGSILKACCLIRGRSAAALSLAVLMNMAMAGVEALFQRRIVRAYDRVVALSASTAMEAMLIAYMYAMLIVLDTIVVYLFLKSCKCECCIEIGTGNRDDGSLVL